MIEGGMTQFILKLYTSDTYTVKTKITKFFIRNC